MARQVEVRVGGGGRVEADFSGFVGEDCYEEADRLSKVLAALGVSVEVLARGPKSPERQRAEAGLPEASRSREGVGG
jgi:hypothetical protein